MKDRGVYKVELVRATGYEELVAAVVVAADPDEAREIASKEARGDEAQEEWLDPGSTNVNRVGSSSADLSYVVLTSISGS